MEKNYIQLIEDLVEELYDSCWSTFLKTIPDYDFDELAKLYWQWLSKEERQKWLADEDFVDRLCDLKDFFIDEIITDIERYWLEYSATYNDEHSYVNPDMEHIIADNRDRYLALKAIGY